MGLVGSVDTPYNYDRFLHPVCGFRRSRTPYHECDPGRPGDRDSPDQRAPLLPAAQTSLRVCRQDRGQITVGSRIRGSRR